MWGKSAGHSVSSICTDLRIKGSVVDAAGQAQAAGWGTGGFNGPGGSHGPFLPLPLRLWIWGPGKGWSMLEPPKPTVHFHSSGWEGAAQPRSMFQSPLCI